MKSINCSKRRKQTPPWLVKQFKRSFESLYVSNRRSKSPKNENSNQSCRTIPKMIYLPPKDQILSSSITVPNEMSVLSRTANLNSSFKIYASKSASNGNLSNHYSQIRTPEKYFSPIKTNWKAVDNIAKVKRGQSVTNLRTNKSPSIEASFDLIDDINNIEENIKSNEKRKFGKKYIKSKLAKLFKSTGKLNDVHKEDKNISQIHLNNKDFHKPPDLPNDALRNLSFTAAMMAKDGKVVGKPMRDNIIEEHCKKIPPSTLRFWRKPSEEKFKANQRRNQDNIYGSNEVLLRINPASDNSKIPSEISLFSDELNGDPNFEFGKLSNFDGKTSVTVVGYDKAFQRYRNIVSQSQHLSRKDRTLSVAYDCENIPSNTNIKMRSCQSSGSVNMLSRGNSVVNSQNDEILRKSAQPEGIRKQYTQKICPTKRFLAQNQHNKICVPSISPPAYDRTLIITRRSRSKATQLTSTVSNQLKPDLHPRIQSADLTSRHVPKPPPRSDSLIRSFELICKNLQTSISEPRGDSFKIFKNQNDYQAWLKNLPYHNPDKISTLLRLRSKVARRQCVSELLNVEISDLNLNKKRRHSWPLLKRTNFPSQNTPTKRSNSLSRVKIKKKPNEEIKIHLDSPSLNNYSRLYCLRNSSATSNNQSIKVMPKYQPELSTKPRPTMSNLKSSAFIIQNRRSGNNRLKPENRTNSRMTESCHETESNSFI